MAQSALGASALAEMAGTFQTPAQVLLHGWSGGAAASWQDVRALQGERERDEAGLLRPSLSDSYFAPLSVAPHREDDREARTQETANRLHPAQTEPEKSQEPERLVLATELMRDPVDDDFLDRVGQALQGPLPSPAGSSAGGAGGAGGAASEHAATGVPSEAGTTGPLATASDPAPPAGGGGAGIAPAGSDSGFDPFLSTGFGQGRRLLATPAAPAGSGSTAAVGAVSGTGSATAASLSTLPTGAANAGGTGGVRPMAAVPPSLASEFGKLPLAFEANVGQAPDAARFVARGRGYGIYLTATEAVLALNAERPASAAQPDQRVHNVLRVQFAGASADAALVGAQELQGRSSYFG